MNKLFQGLRATPFIVIGLCLGLGTVGLYISIRACHYLFPPQHYLWSQAMTNQVGMVVVRPCAKELDGDVETISRAICINDRVLVRALAVEMTGSEWDPRLWKDQSEHWIETRRIYLDFDCGTQKVSFIIGLHYKYPLAQAEEICQEGTHWSTGKPFRSHRLYLLLDTLPQSNNVSWVKTK